MAPAYQDREIAEMVKNQEFATHRIAVPQVRADAADDVAYRGRFVVGRDRDQERDLADGMRMGAPASRPT
jgi:hypothetical protein